MSASRRPRAWRRSWTAPGSSGSATRCSPAGSSRSTPASGRPERPGPRRTTDEPQRRPAAGDPGPRRRRGLAAAADGGGRGAARPSSSAVDGERSAAQAGATLAAGGKRLRPMLVLLCAGDATPARRRSAPRPRSSSSTWRPWSTTTCSTPRRCAAGTRPSSPAPGAPAATAVGDLLFSRAFAELADGEPGSERRVALLAGASVGLARGELAQRRDAFDLANRRRALPRALPAEDRAPVRVRLPDRARRRTRRRRRGAGDVRARDRARLPAPRRRPRRRRARRSAPARRAAPTCSTAR